jgi:uncharacterized membrane protein
MKGSWYLQDEQFMDQKVSMTGCPRSLLKVMVSPSIACSVKSGATISLVLLLLQAGSEIDSNTASPMIGIQNHLRLYIIQFVFASRLLCSISEG